MFQLFGIPPQSHWRATILQGYTLLSPKVCSPSVCGSLIDQEHYQVGVALVENGEKMSIQWGTIQLGSPQLPVRA